eukprot:110418_1
MAVNFDDLKGDKDKSYDIDDFLDEIDEKEKANNSKSEWKIGTECEIYSRSEKRWLKGVIIKIFKDKEGEWIVVKYNINTVKEIQRYSDHIRPLMPPTNDDIQSTTVTLHNDGIVDLQANVNWNEIVTELKKANANYIKTLITSNDIDINSQNPENGKTLLIYAVIIGSEELVRVICNFGADVHIKDQEEFDALDYAIKYGRYKITEIVYYQQLSGTLGKDLKEIATKIHQKNKEAELMKQFQFEFFVDDGGDEKVMFAIGVCEYMISAIRNRSAFGQDMLYYAWYFILHGKTFYDDKMGDDDDDDEYSSDEDEWERERYVKHDNCMESKLWKVMMKTFEQILKNTSDKQGWSWLKKYFINSLIWFLPHPLYEDTKARADDEDDMETTLKGTMFYELLWRVRKESKRQSDRLLKDRINTIKSEKPSEWNQLTQYNVNTAHSRNARQDLCGCLIPKYTETDLSEELYPPSTHFNAKKHYDKNIYLNELLFNANILDDVFQKHMKLITKEIALECDMNAKYRAGPVKTLTRSQTKVDNDYIKEDYPTAAKILDINRCALQFQEIHDMMRFIASFTNKIANGKARSIIEIIRCKNGWSVYNPNYPQYTDVKLNVLVQSPLDPEKKVVAEIQFLLDLMCGFKKKAHKLYSVERKFEMIYNFAKLRNEMRQFNQMDLGNTNSVICELARNDDIKYFKDLWNSITPDSNTLMDGAVDADVWKCAVICIMDQKGEIHDFLERKYKDLYCDTIMHYLRKYGETHIKKDDIIDTYDEDEEEQLSGYKLMIQSICTKPGAEEEIEGHLVRFIKKIFDLVKHDEEKDKALFDLFTAFKDKSLVGIEDEEDLEEMHRDDDFDESIDHNNMFGLDDMGDDEDDDDMDDMDDELDGMEDVEDANQMDDDMDDMNDAMDDDMDDMDDDTGDMDEIDFFQLENEMGAAADTKHEKEKKEKKKPNQKQKEEKKDTDNGMSFVEAICDSEAKYCKAVKLLLNKSVALFCTPQNNKSFVYACKQRDGRNALQILSCALHDKQLFLQLLNQKDNKGITALEMISRNNSISSTRLIQLILNNHLLSDEEKDSLFISDSAQMMNRMGKYGNADNVFMILHHVNSSWTQTDCVSLLKSNAMNFKDCSPRILMHVHKTYFADDKRFLWKRLAADKHFLLKKICKRDKYIRIFRYILYQSQLNYRAVLRLLLESPPNASKLYYDDNGYNSSLTLNRSGLELVKYLQNDRKQLLKLLHKPFGDTKAKQSSFWIMMNKSCAAMSYGFDGDSPHDVHNYEVDAAINSVLTNPILSEPDRSSLLYAKDAEGNTPLYAAFTLSTESANRLQCLLKIIKSDVLFKLLTQECGPSSKAAILYCNSKLHLECIFRVLNDRQISMILSEHKRWEHREVAKPIITQWKQYKKFAEKIHKMKSIDVSFDKYKHNPFISAVKFGNGALVKKVMDKIRSESGAQCIQLLTRKAKYPRSAMKQILSTMDEEFNTDVLEMVLFQNGLLSDKDRLKILFALTLDNLAEDRDDFDLYSLEEDNVYNIAALLRIAHYLRNDRKLLKRVLSNKQTQDALIQASEQISDKARVLQMVNLYVKEPMEWIEALSIKSGAIDGSSTLLMSAAQYSFNSELMQCVMDGICKMNDKMQLKLLMTKDFNEKKFIFCVANVEMMHIVLRTLDNDISEKLLKDTVKQQDRWSLEEKKFTLHQLLRQNDEKQEMQILIERFLEYVQFDKVLDQMIAQRKHGRGKSKRYLMKGIDLSFKEYATNPFMTACSLNKQETIMKLLRYVGGDEEQLQSLLLDNLNHDNGNNCLMEMAQHGNYSLLLNILDSLVSEYALDNKVTSELLATKNTASGQTLQSIMMQSTKANDGMHSNTISQIFDLINQ